MGYGFSVGGWGYHANSENIEYKSCGILTSIVWSVVAGHVMITIHRVHNFETNRTGPVSRQILVLSGLDCSVRLWYFLIMLTFSYSSILLIKIQ